MRSGAALLLLAACQGGGPKDVAPAGGDDDGAVEREDAPPLVEDGDTEDAERGCRIRLIGTRPHDEAAHYRRSPVELYFSDVDASAQLWVTGSDGEPVDGLETRTGAFVTLQPEPPLAPSTAYTLHATWCDGEETLEQPFETSELGAPPEDCDPADGAWLLALHDGRVPDLGSVTPYILGELDPTPVLDLTPGEDGGAPVASIGWSRGTGGAQDYCEPTTDLGPVTWDAPFLRTAPTDVVIPGEDVLLAGVVFEADVAPDCTRVGGLKLTAQLDARHIGATWTAELGDADAICAVLDGFGEPCGPCDSDDAVYCIDLVIEESGGDAAAAAVECVAEADCHPLCPLNDAACDPGAYPTCE